MPRHHYKRALNRLCIVKFRKDGVFNDRVAIVSAIDWHTLTLQLLCEEGLKDEEVVVNKGNITYLETFNWEELEDAQTKAKEEAELFPKRAEEGCSKCGSDRHETGECID